MKDVTQLFNNYRECIRNLWNIHFIQIESSNTWNLFEEYDEICSKLFGSLLLNQVGRPEYIKSSACAMMPEPLLFFRVFPSVETGVPINISREKNSYGYWDNPIAFIKPDEADMRFIDFFDFDLIGFRDFQFCRVKIIDSKAYPDLKGYDALLECNHIKIFFDDIVL